MYSDPLAKNRYLQRRIRELGYDPSEFLVLRQTRRWYHELFKLPQRLMPRYEQFLAQTKPRQKSKLICAQVRVGQKSAKGQRDDFFMNRNETVLYWDLIKREFIHKLYANTSDYKIFVTSDREDVKEEARGVFGSDHVVATEHSSFHFDRDFRKANDPQCQVLENVLFDFHVMQHCDAAVVSHSGFGILAMMNRERPNENLFVYSLADQRELKKSVWKRAGKKFKFHKIRDITKDIYFV